MFSQFEDQSLNDFEWPEIQSLPDNYQHIFIISSYYKWLNWGILKHSVSESFTKHFFLSMGEIIKSSIFNIKLV